jgi:hypothetical protein
MKTKINVGVIVQNNSRGWDSIINLSIVLLLRVEIILKATILVIRIKIVMVWSWKKISCSIRGDEAFWNPIAAQDEISKRNFLFHGWGLNPVQYSAILESSNKG